MEYLIVSLITLGLITAVSSFLAHRRHGEPPVVMPDGAGDCTTCSGFSEKCEQECMLEAATKPVEYFDDEELDAYKGRHSDAYTLEETEQFAEVLETLKPHEVAAWGRSLQLRGINLPDELKDEYVALVE